MASSFVEKSSDGSTSMHASKSHARHSDTTSTTTHSSTAPSSVKQRKNEVHGWRHMMAGSIAGITAKTVLQPLDLVKVRLQVQDTSHTGGGAVMYRGVFHALRSIVSTDGFLGLYRGLAPNLMASGVSWGCYFFVYARAKDSWRRFISSDEQERNGTKRLPHLAHLTCAAAAGVCGITATNPIVMVKTRLQLQGTSAEHHRHASTSTSTSTSSTLTSTPTQHTTPSLSTKSTSPAVSNPVAGHASGKPYTGTINCFVRIAREEGILSFYRGLGPALLLVSNGSIQFAIYEELRRLCATAVGGESNLTPPMFFVMSGSAKFAATVVTYPLSVIRSRSYQRVIDSQTHQSRPKYDSVLQIVRHVLNYEGFRGFYRGFLAHLMKTTPSSAITFTTYEVVVKALNLLGESKQQQL